MEQTTIPKQGTQQQNIAQQYQQIPTPQPTMQRQTMQPTPLPKERFGTVNTTLTTLNILLVLAVAWVFLGMTTQQTAQATTNIVTPTPLEQDYNLMQQNAEQVSNLLRKNVTLYRYGEVALIDETHSLQDNTINYCITIGGLIRYSDGNNLIARLMVATIISDTENKIIKEGDIALDNYYEQTQLDNIKICDNTSIEGLDSGDYKLNILVTDIFHKKMITKEIRFTIPNEATTT